MKIFAIADPHLSTGAGIDKPMDVFGTRWQNHTERLKQGWLEKVSPEDIVIIPGDISWGLKLGEAMADFDWLHALPGRKLISKGNHDLWWTSLKKLNTIHEDITFLHNSHFKIGNLAICGAKGWTLPQYAKEWTEHDDKMTERQAHRLKLALDSAMEAGAKRIIVAMHYPPTCKQGKDTPYTRIIREYPVSEVIYGHLHGDDGTKNSFNAKKDGIPYRLVSSDCINFTPVLIEELSGERHE